MVLSFLKKPGRYREKKEKESGVVWERKLGRKSARRTSRSVIGTERHVSTNPRSNEKRK